MELNPTESWLYTLSHIELPRFANAFNTNVAEEVPNLKDHIARYIKKRMDDKNIPLDADDTLYASLSVIQEDPRLS